MKLRHVVAAATLASEGLALNFSETISDIPELSNMAAFISQNSSLQSAFDTPKNITVLAPNNDAFNDLVGTQSNGSAPLGNSSLITGILKYHVLKGVYNESNFKNENQFIPTLLDDSTFANVSNGQVVRISRRDDSIHCITGLNDDVQFVNQTRSFDNGVVHVIDGVLTLPQSVTTTATFANLRAFTGAVTNGSVSDDVNGAKDVTVFAPNDEGFVRVGSVFSNISTQNLGRIAQYHVVQGNVIYSTEMKNETLPTEAGKDLHLTVVNGTAFVNSAKVLSSDLLTNNGVLHIISDVLNPENPDIKPDPKANDQPIAFAGASSSQVDPLTSGQPSPTSTGSIEPSKSVGTGGGGGGGVGGGGGGGGGAGGTTTITASPTKGVAAALETANAHMAAAVALGAALLNI
ncbi:hypothetical protein LOZ58_000622 [Ophidiomyces ophidiicola]|nr:hypothetical protein LOZ58_000622 [Ophidiomyces ophidiicola]